LEITPAQFIFRLHAQYGVSSENRSCETSLLAKVGAQLNFYNTHTDNRELRRSKLENFTSLLLPPHYLPNLSTSTTLHPNVVRHFVSLPQDPGSHDAIKTPAQQRHPIVEIHLTSSPRLAFLLAGSSEPRVASNRTVLMVSSLSSTDSEISPLDGLEQSRVIHYSTLQAFCAAVRQLRNNLGHGHTKNQYLIVRDVDEDIMKHIEDREYKGVRYEWHGDLEVLIVKVPTESHESAATEFGFRVANLAEAMGIPPIERRLVGTATFWAAAGTPRKQPDWSMKPASIRPTGQFPTIVIEVGFSESLRNCATTPGCGFRYRTTTFKSSSS